MAELLPYPTELARVLDAKQRRRLRFQEGEKSRDLRLAPGNNHFDGLIARQVEERVVVQPVVASISGDLAESRPARYSHLSSVVQQPEVEQLTMVTLTFENENAEHDAIGHNPSSRTVVIPSTVNAREPPR